MVIRGIKVNERFNIGVGTPLKEYAEIKPKISAKTAENKCTCCGSPRLKKVLVNGKEYEVCKDCLDEGYIKNLHLIKDID